MDWLKKLLEETSDTAQLEQKISEKLKSEYVAKKDYDLVAETKTALEGQIVQRDKDIAALKESAKDNAKLQDEYAKLEKKYKLDTENLQKKYHETCKNNAVDVAIIKAKGKNTKAIKALLDMDKITLQEDGTLKGLDLDTIKKSDSYLFDIVETHREGVQSGADSSFYSNQGNEQGGGSIFSLFSQSAKRAAGINTERGN